MSYTCPYSDVRQTFQGLLTGLKVSIFFLKKILFKYVMDHLCRNHTYRKQQALLYQNPDINHLLILFHCTIFSLSSQAHPHHPIMLFILVLQIYRFRHGLLIPVKMNNKLYIHNKIIITQIYQKLSKITLGEDLQMNMYDK